jgi:(2Fe-2S) ferredoxin
MPLSKSAKGNKTLNCYNEIAQSAGGYRFAKIFTEECSKMPKQSESPYVAHVFVCTNDRHGARKSCADNNSPLTKANLKEIVNERGWRGKVRISTSGCMGLCDKGSNVMIYPQRIWFSETRPDEVDEIVSTLERIMADDCN